MKRNLSSSKCKFNYFPYKYTIQSESGKHLYLWPKTVSEAHPKSNSKSLTLVSVLEDDLHSRYLGTVSNKNRSIWGVRYYIH